jgi:hypothetical protein
MKTMQTHVLGILAAVGLAAVPALAVPPALDHVSADTPIIIGVQSLSGLTADAQQWIGTFAPPEAAMGLMMVNQLLQTPGLNADGSAAVALSFPQGTMDSEPVPTIVLPIQDFTVFVEAMQGDASDDVAAINFMEETLFVKNLGGGFMALGPEMGLIEDFDGSAGRGAAHEARLGSRGATASDQADIFVVIDVESMRPMLEMGLAQASEQMEMAAMMGGEAAAQQIEVMLGAAESIMNDGQTAFVGLGATDDGMWIDVAGQFADGSETGGMFSDGGDSSSLFGALPNMDYIFAMAFDSSNAGIRRLMSAAAQMNQGMGMGLKTEEIMELNDGQAMVMGVSPGLLTGGLLTNTVQFTASDHPAELLEAMKDATAEMDGMSQEGILFHTSFEENAAEVAGQNLHAWGFTMEGDPNHENGVAAGMALQQMTFVFGGQAGPSGYMATTEHGIYSSYSKNSKLMERVLTGKGEPMSANESIRMVGSHLPEERTGEMYVNIKGVLDMVLPMLSMMGMGADLGDLPEKMNPIGFALATGGGGMHARLFVPGDVLEFGAALAEQFGGGDEWEDVEDEPESKPRF